MDPRRSATDIPPPQLAAVGLLSVAHRLLLINRPCRDGTLSLRWYTAAAGGSRTHDLAIASLAPYHSATTYRVVVLKDMGGYRPCSPCELFMQSPLSFPVRRGEGACHSPNRLQEGLHALRVGRVDVVGGVTCLRVRQAAK